jgi:uncharacterized membrane protein YgcG
MQTWIGLLKIPFKAIGVVAQILSNLALVAVVITLVTTAATKDLNLGIAASSEPAPLPYPSRVSRHVNDTANLLSEPQKAALRAQLAEVEQQDGAEVTLLTLGPYQAYGTGDGSLESFATALFDAWNLDTHAVLILISVRGDGHGDVRIELGRDYGRAYDAAMQRVVDDDMLPHFRAQEYAQGIQAGTQSAIAALRNGQGEPGWLRSIRDALATSRDKLGQIGVLVFLLLGIIGVVQRRFLSGGLWRNLAGLGLTLLLGALLGVSIGSAIGLTNVEPWALQNTLGQFKEALTSGSFLSEIATMSRATVVGTLTGIAASGILWFMRGGYAGGSRYGGMGGSGGGSSGGGGAGGSW